MADQATDPHASLWAKLAHHRTPHTLQYRVVHLGFWSSIVLLVMMILDIPAPSLFAEHYVAIAIVYLVLQLSEILWRDALNWPEVLEGAFFAFIPALFSLLVLGLDWYSGYTMLTSAGFTVMSTWFWFAWILFLFAVAAGVKMPTIAYRRQESGVPKS